MPQQKQIQALRQLKGEFVPVDDLGRKRIKRSESARIEIPEPENMARRESCMNDPEKFLREYFKRIFYNPFASHHVAMIDAIWRRCWGGGDKAIAAPRGDGKSQITICMAVVAHIATPIRFPVLIGNTLSKGKKLFKQFKSKFENASRFPEFFGDFPELCVPVVELRGAPQRAASQHVDGELTRITWSQELVVMPTIQCPWATNPVGGKRLVYFGLDSAIRGEGFEDDRPDMAIIDDPETREVAFSPTDRHTEIEDMIDGDVAGLSGPNSRISRIVLTTIQNRRCYSYRVTDPNKKSTFAGERHGMLSRWPDNREKWEEYVSLRQQDQANGDKDGKNAINFYIENREEMDRGAVVTNPNRFVQEPNENGEIVELSALQSFFNRIADWGLPKVLAELQNDPEEDETEQTLGLTAGIVQIRQSGLIQNELPKVDCRIVAGIDVGKYWSHWVKVAMWENATGVIIDYGVLETPGMKVETEPTAVQIALLKALDEWRSKYMETNIPELVFIDSGDYTDAVYEFTRRAGNVFKPTKGNDGRMAFTGADSERTRFFEQCRMDYQQQSRLWLFHVNVNHWKHVVQQRFLTETFNEGHQFNDGTLSLFVPTNSKDHNSYAHHIVSEEFEELFIEGKGLQRKWVVKNKNNHWLDATALACAAAGALGIRTIPRQSLQSVPQNPKRPQAKPSSQNRYRQRQGGWIPKRRV